MALRSRLARIVRRDPDRPSLRERFGALKARLTRHRQEMSEGRRSLLAGAASAVVLPFGAVSAKAAALIVPAPVATAVAAIVPTVHPDAALIEASHRLDLAKVALDAAKAAHGAASKASAADSHPCPDELRFTLWERCEFGSPMRRREGWGGFSARWLPAEGYRHDQAWTAAALRQVIERATAVLGPAGYTPKLLKRWRAILPIAEAYDAHCDEVRARHDLDALLAVMKEAEATHATASAIVSEMPATTLDGLKIKIGQFSFYKWQAMPAAWATIIEAAGALAGTPLPVGEFDPGAWVERWREAGGHIRYSAHAGEWETVYPERGREPDELVALRCDREGHWLTLRRWLRATNGGEA